MQFPASVPSWAVRIGFGLNKALPQKVKPVVQKENIPEINELDAIHAEFQKMVEVSRQLRPNEGGARLLKVNGILYDPESNTYFTN